MENGRKDQSDALVTECLALLHVHEFTAPPGHIAVFADCPECRASFRFLLDNLIDENEPLVSLILGVADVLSMDTMAALDRADLVTAETCLKRRDTLLEGLSSALADADARADVRADECRARLARLDDECRQRSA